MNDHVWRVENGICSVSDAVVLGTRHCTATMSWKGCWMTPAVSCRRCDNDHSAATVPEAGDGTTFFIYRWGEYWMGYCGTWRRATFAKGWMLDDGMMTLPTLGCLLVGDTYCGRDDRDAGWDGATFGGSVVDAGDGC